MLKADVLTADGDGSNGAQVRRKLALFVTDFSLLDVESDGARGADTELYVVKAEDVHLN